MTSFKHRVLSNKLLSGGWMFMGHSDIAEIASTAGYDWLLLDTEHGAHDWRDLLNQLQAIGSNSDPIIRVASINEVEFKRVLDLGPTGLMIPDVRNCDDAERVVYLARVPPQGMRSVATSTRNSQYGLDYPNYIKTINQELVLMAQIESREAIQNIDEIASVDGIDVLFVGPTDLGNNLGIQENNPDNSEFRFALQTVSDAAARFGKAAGALVRNTEQAKQYLDLGFTIIALGSDRGIIAKGLRASAFALNNLKNNGVI